MSENKTKHFGAIESPIDVRDYRLDVSKVEVFPETFELDLTAVPVKNQGMVGSCVAHALSEVIQWHNNRQHNDQTVFSTGFIYGNRLTSTYKGEGMIVRDALKAIQSSGDVDKASFNYNIEVPEAIDKFNKKYNELFPAAYPNRISTYYRVYTKQEIKKALMQHGPVVFAIKWYSDMTVKNGIMTHVTNQDDGGHCMIIYGWNENGWLIQNSWGTSWGNKGRAIMPYDMPLVEAWGVTDDIMGLDIIEPYHNVFFRLIAKFLNFILNLFRKKNGGKNE